MARGPRSGNAPAPAENPGGNGGSRTAASPQPFGNPRGGAPSVAKQEPFAPQKAQPKPEPQPPESFTAKSPATPAPAAPQFVNPRPGTPGATTSKTVDRVQSQPKAEQKETIFQVRERPAAKTSSPTIAPAAKPNKKPSIGLIIILAVAIAAGGVVHFWPTRPKEQADSFNSHTTADPRTPQRTVSIPSPLATPVLKSQPEPVPPAVVSAVEPDSVTPATDSSKPVQTDSQTQGLEERARAIQRTTTALTNRIAQLAKFTADCEAKLDANDAKLPSFGPDDRAILKHNNDSARTTIENNLKTQASSLNGFLVILTAYAARPNEDPQPTIEKLTNYFAKLDKIHGEITGIFVNLDRDFAPDPH